MESASDPPADLTGNLKTVLSFCAKPRRKSRDRIELGRRLKRRENGTIDSRAKGEIQRSSIFHNPASSISIMREV